MQPILVPKALLEWGPVTLVCVLFMFALPVTVIAFYVLRLGARRNSLLARVYELRLEPEYLRVYDVAEWKRIASVKDENEVRTLFAAAFNRQFRGDNKFLAYLPPLALLVISTLIFVAVVLQLWVTRAPNATVLQHASLFAMAGALVYVYPLLIRRYAALSLNPQAVYQIVGSLWLSFVVGVVAGNLADPALKPLTAFIGSVLPIPMFNLLRSKVLTERTPAEQAEAAAQSDLLEIVGQDRDLFDQLGYIGIRSVRALAFENPIRIFVEADPNLVNCVDLVDQANFYLIIPERDARAALSKLGIRTAVDLMTRIYDEFPRLDGRPGSEFRYLRPTENVPEWLHEPLNEVAEAMRVDGVEVVRNVLFMLSENPQLTYLQNLWGYMNDSIGEAFEYQQDTTKRLRGVPLVVPV